jgi:serpin B
MTHLIKGLIIVAILGMVGCAAQPTAGPPPKSDKARITSPSAADLAQLVGGNSAFALDLYRALVAEGEGNLFYSPHSISLALAMCYAGARGETERQMAEVMHLTLAQEQLHPAFNYLDLELAKRGSRSSTGSGGAQGKDGEGFRLNIVNATWAQEGYPFLSEYLDMLAENYGAGLRTLDLSKDPEAARATINDWVSEQTEKRIEHLIPQGVINPTTRLVLTNAIYFNAAWANPFDPQRTTDGPFHLLDGSEIIVPLMQQKASFGYTESEGLQIVELPYDGHELSMVILLPAEGALESLEQELDANRINAVLNELGYQEVVLTMPKFKVESDFGLAKTLQTMGMTDAFASNADLSGIDGSKDLFIQDVVHKAFVDVDEAGTEAAAATAVMIALKAMPQQPVTMTIDRPFVFFIRDIQTGTVLFVGRIVDPGA